MFTSDNIRLIKILERFLHALYTYTIKLISIGSYFPEISAFGTLIMSTEVFSLDYAKSFDHAPR